MTAPPTRVVAAKSPDWRAWDAAAEESLQKECAARVEAAVAEYLATPKQSTDTMFDYLFATTPRHLAGQRATARRYAGAGGTQGGH